MMSCIKKSSLYKVSHLKGFAFISSSLIKKEVHPVGVALTLVIIILLNII